MWKRIILIIPFPKIVPQINACLRHIFGNRYKNDILKKIESGSGNQDIHGYFKKYQPHLSFTISEKKQGIKFLSDLGIPDGSPYVCLFVRDSAYLSKYFPDRDWSYHNYRDCDIDNFRKAALFLADLGYYVIRMGKVVLKSLDVNHEKVIDYANCSIRSDFCDIYLTAHCDFFISTPSGLDGVAQIFRRPILLVNMPIFVPGCLDYWYPSKLFITKKFFDRTRNKFISLKELDNVLLNTVNFQKTSEDLNWIPIENDEDEILEAVREMVNSFEKKNEEDSLSNPLHGLLKTQLKSIVKWLLMLAVFPIAILIWVIRPLYKIQFIMIPSTAIGHYAGNVDTFLVDQAVNPRKKTQYIFYYHLNTKPINMQLHLMWSRVIPIVTAQWVTKIIVALELLSDKIGFFGKIFYNIRGNNFDAGDRDKTGKMANSHSFLKFTPDEVIKGEEGLLTMGIPKDAKFIVLHSRDRAFLAGQYFRNTEIESFFKAAKYFFEKGYYVVRTGACVSNPIPSSEHYIIDYARTGTH